MHKEFKLLAFLITCLFSFSAHAEIYKRVDANGRVTYSNVKIQGGKKINIEPAYKASGNKSSAEYGNRKKSYKSSPDKFPKVDNNTQNSRDAKRREILQEELNQEKQALKKAKKAYDEGAANPEVSRGANGKTFRNVAKYNEKMKNLQATVDAHTRNINLLEKELNK